MTGRGCIGGSCNSDGSETYAFNRIFLVMFLVGISVAIVDQLSKWMVVKGLRVGEIVPVVEGFFNLTLTYNKGIAFGMLASLPDSVRLLALVGGTIVAGATISVVMFREFCGDRYACLALAAIIGGAVGNLIDRVRLGAVVDFLDVFLGTYHWPAFNFADSAICVGVGVLMVRSLGGSTKVCSSGSDTKGV